MKITVSMSWMLLYGLDMENDYYLNGGEGD